jgi:CBS domain containing-hemolysin-like protein
MFTSKSVDLIGDMYTLLIVFFLISICFSFLCSLWEAVLLSVTPSYAQMKLEEGTATGESLREFKENIDRPLAAILTLNTVAHTAGAIGVGVQASAIWENSFPIMTTVVVPVLMTLGILVLSEIIPKTIGANNWERLAPFTVISLNIIITLLSPLIWFLQLITRALKSEEVKSVLSRKEFLLMTQIGAREGVIDKGESEIIRNLLRFDTIKTESIMTPRTVLEAARAEATLQEFYDKNENLRFSRIPIYKGQSKDQVIGFFLKDDLLSGLVKGNGSEPLESIKREIMVVENDTPLPKLFDLFVSKREHIALVVGSFGGTAGVVTMEDVIETLLGLEIVDEFDHIEDMQVLARRSWEKRAKALGIIPEGGEAPRTEVEDETEE